MTDASAADAAAGFRYEYDLDDDGTLELGGGDVRHGVALAAVDVRPR